MTITTPHTSSYSPALRGGLLPRLAFLAALFVVLAVWSGMAGTLPAGLAIPVVATLLLAFGAVAGGAAWLQRAGNSSHVTYGDVAGALILIGLFVAALIDPTQMHRAVFG